jgi:hypothetical protein
MPPGHIGPPASRGDRAIVARLIGLIRSTHAVVGSPIRDRSAEWVRR